VDTRASTSRVANRYSCEGRFATGFCVVRLTRWNSPIACDVPGATTEQPQLVAVRFQHNAWNSIAFLRLLGCSCECPCLSEPVGDLDPDFNPPMITASVGQAGQIFADRTRRLPRRQTSTETSTHIAASRTELIIHHESCFVLSAEMYFYLLQLAQMCFRVSVEYAKMF
jgi:hypothetical protein